MLFEGMSGLITVNCTQNKMIIDSHVHIGSIMDWNFPAEVLLAAMDKHQIDFALLSNISGGEFVGETLENPGSQLEINETVKHLVAEHPQRLKALYWIRPHLEGFNQTIKDYLQKNSLYFCGLKVHPTQSRLAFTTENHHGYLDMCARLNLPVAVHTEADSFADPELVYKTAKENPGVNFIMVHLGLRTDHRQAIEYVKELPNLYGDTTFVDEESVLHCIRLCGSDKVLFGTDSPTFGVDTYSRYETLLQRLKKELNPVELENVLYKNAVRLFKLDHNMKRCRL